MLRAYNIQYILCIMYYIGIGYIILYYYLLNTKSQKCKKSYTMLCTFVGMRNVNNCLYRHYSGEYYVLTVFYSNRDYI